ncbi:J domain-containing protein [Halomicrococcus sp. SG-WS-1]|uniref:J domain-containing protein n=1 Tax=Halomicrococcus sp. SG-WS-1 TaxID=3439057 RepID=UPI003F7AA928
MHRSRLLLGIAAVFAGLTASLAILGFVYNLFLLVFAVPFAITTAILWYHATGRLARKVREGEFQERRQRGFGPDPRTADTRAREGAGRRASGGAAERGRERAEEWARQRARGGAGERQRASRRGRRTYAGNSGGPSAAEAYSILDVDPEADEESVRQAYREKVKTVHPDREDGSEEAFKRVNSAYERLQDDR